LAVKGYIPGAKRIMKLAVSEKADWFIAHTQAALPLAASCAKRWKARLGFDCEDLLTENGTDPPEIVRLIERKFLPLCDYVTVPSKQIGSRLVKDYGVRSPIVLYNAFPQRLAKILVPPEERPRNSRIRLCWFGQTIGPGRGIEEAIIALGKLGQKVELHLRGRLSKDYQTTLVKLMASVDGGSRLNFLPLVDHEKLMQDMGQFDVGLCLERIERTNYALTVTNKLFAYLLAGLAVAATDTPGQREILEQIPSAGFLYPAGNPESLAKGLERWIDNLETLRSAQQAAWNAARERFCWDKEKEKFLRIFN